MVDLVKSDDTLAETEKESLVIARRGQGKFKENVMQLERHCRVTRVDRMEHLRASHIKPWRDCLSADERLNGENGFLLTPSIDHLFDRGFITFEDSGRLVVSSAADNEALRRMGVDANEKISVGKFSEGQRRFLDHHRDSVFLASRMSTS